MANEVGVAVLASQLEVPVLGRQPRVDDLRHVDSMAAENQGLWRLLAAMTSVTLDRDGEEPLLMHPITTRLWPCGHMWL